MNTKIIMILSSLIMGLLGVAGSFLPQELLGYLKLQVTFPMPLMIQILGALYFGFAMVNWMAKNNLIGGIYGKPVAMGNFAHFFIAALALIKGLQLNPDLMIIWIITVIYSVFAIIFGYVAFTNPLDRKNAD